MKGIVVKSTGSWYLVRLESNEIQECRIKGKFKLEGLRATNPIAVGDMVEVEEGVICRISERKNYIIRKATNLSKEVHIIAANVDQAVLIVTVNHPVTSTVFIDRFLASVEAYGIPVVLVFNKIDIYSDEDLDMMNVLKGIYSKIGYTCLQASSVTQEGVQEIREMLKGKISVLSGLSGVGKSSLINQVEPGLQLKVAEISEFHDTGRHTTTFAEMFPLTFGGWVVDTPGIRAFGMVRMKKNEISHYFPEIIAKANMCRFNNCTHTHEPGCAVLAAVEEGDISESRYSSYLSMYEEGDEKYRK